MSAFVKDKGKTDLLSLWEVDLPQAACACTRSEDKHSDKASM